MKLNDFLDLITEKCNVGIMILGQLPPTEVGGLSLISRWSNRRNFLPPSLLLKTKQLKLLFRNSF